MKTLLLITALLLFGFSTGAFAWYKSGNTIITCEGETLNVPLGAVIPQWASAGHAVYNGNMSILYTIENGKRCTNICPNHDWVGASGWYTCGGSE